MALLGGGDYDTVCIALMLLHQGLLLPCLLGWPLGLWGSDCIQAFTHWPWRLFAPCCPANGGVRALWIPYFMAKRIAE